MFSSSYLSPPGSPCPPYSPTMGRQTSRDFGKDVLGKTTRPSATGGGRRNSKRATAALVVLVGLLLLDLFWLKLLFAPSEELGNTKEADTELIRVLLLTRNALEVETEIEDIAGFADRFIALGEMKNLEETMEERFPQLNTTTLATYKRSLAYHHDKLFVKLFPFVNRSPKQSRSLEALRAHYTAPQGIIIPVGRDQFQYAVHLIATLKHVHNTSLPIQVAYAGNEDLPPPCRAALRSISPDVEMLNVLDFFDEEHVGLKGGGWAIKSFALLASTFQEIIILDADAIFLQPPERLFDDPGYIETGTLFFRDREIFPGDGDVHKWWRGVMEGRTPSEEMMKSRFWTEMASREEMESGVVVFDKRRKDVVMGLVLTGQLNTKAVREPVTYAYTYGDKESFWMAFELGRIPYHFDPPYAALIGQLTHPDRSSHSVDSRICSDHLFHLDHTGRPFWFNGSLFQQKRVKSKGWFMATHWTYGTVEWDCEPEPWCMKNIREVDVRRLSHGGYDRVLTDMIGAALVWEAKFSRLIEKHCDRE